MVTIKKHLAHNQVFDAEKEAIAYLIEHDSDSIKTRHYNPSTFGVIEKVEILDNSDTPFGVPMVRYFYRVVYATIIQIMTAVNTNGCDIVYAHNLIASFEFEDGSSLEIQNDAFVVHATDGTLLDIIDVLKDRIEGNLSAIEMIAAIREKTHLMVQVRIFPNKHSKDLV